MVDCCPSLSLSPSLFFFQILEEQGNEGEREREKQGGQRVQGEGGGG